MRIGIWWIRRDLRLHDNPALTAARERALALSKGIPATRRETGIR